MRKIKFRARDSHSGIWIYLHILPGHFIHESASEEFIREKDMIGGNLTPWLQYIGLKDKNGDEIYEGDVILVEDSYTDVILEDGSGPQEPDNHLTPVIFNEEFGAFGVNIENGGDYIDDGFNSFETINGQIGLEKLEIIGNIHENPELLKERIKA